MRGELAGLIVCLFAALVPFAEDSSRPSTGVQSEFSGWPVQLDGKPLMPLPLSGREKAFAAGFAGRVGRFTDGNREIVIRWVPTPTSQLHPASDCFRGMGYAIQPQPLHVDPEGNAWQCFLATRNKDVLRVFERITGEDGAAWTDVSAWYWAATLGTARGPWWAVTVAERAPAG